jgi:regulator of nucleoside diphosphate kinase
MNRASRVTPDGALAQAENVSATWLSQYCGTRFVIDENELYCLRSIALSHDDETVSHLLLRKLRLAKAMHASLVPLDVVVLNSIVDYTFGDRRSLVSLVHPSAAPAGERLSVASLTGAGLIGLRVGQKIVWPGEDGHLRELTVHSVERRGSTAIQEEARRLKRGN